MKISRWRVKITDRKSSSKKKRNMDKRRMRLLKNKKSMGKKKRKRRIVRLYPLKISHRRATEGRMLIIKKSKIIAKLPLHRLI